MVVMLSTIVLLPQAKAQDENKSMIRYGPKLGMTVSSFSDSQPHTGYNIGFTVGGFVEYGVTDQLSLQAEPAYLEQGGSYVRFIDDSRFGTGALPQHATSSRTTVRNIDLPLLAKYQVAQFGDLKTTVVLGPAVSYTISATDAYETTYIEDRSYRTVNNSRNVTSQYEPFTFGVTAGFGGEVNIGANSLFIDFRYRYGITSTKKGYSYIDLYDVQGDLRTHSAYVTIGISL